MSYTIYHNSHISKDTKHNILITSNLCKLMYNNNLHNNKGNISITIKRIKLKNYNESFLLYWGLDLNDIGVAKISKEGKVTFNINLSNNFNGFHYIICNKNKISNIFTRYLQNTIKKRNGNLNNINVPILKSKKKIDKKRIFLRSINKKKKIPLLTKWDTNQNPNKNMCNTFFDTNCNPYEYLKGPISGSVMGTSYAVQPFNM